MGTLTSAEILLILRKLCPEGGYSKEPEVAQLQAKLSIMLEVAQRRETQEANQQNAQTLGDFFGKVVSGRSAKARRK